MKNIAITIARQYGSGGREIGKKLAQKLNIDFFDKEILSITAKKNGLNEKMFEEVDEKPTNSFLYSLAMGAYAMDGHYIYQGDITPSINDRVYQMQSEIIKELSDQKSCIFVGRCADYILEDHACLIKIFIAADMEDRKKRVALREPGLSERKLEVLIVKTDKRRANYYSYHTNLKWGVADNYDLSLNTSRISPENAVELIAKYIELKSGEKIL